MNERIKLIRKDFKLTQTAFAERLGIKQNTVAQLEKGNRNPSEQLIKSICREFAISYDWLKNGVEPMKMPAEEAALDSIERIMTGDNEFVKSVFRELADLPPEAWEEIESFMNRFMATKKGR